MTGKQSKHKSTFDADKTPLSNMKPTYEAPRSIPLGEVAKGVGACLDGSSAFDCYSGSLATDNCGVGSGGTPPG